jgi:hypothetical protein
MQNQDKDWFALYEQGLPSSTTAVEHGMSEE